MKKEITVLIMLLIYSINATSQQLMFQNKYIDNGKHIQAISMIKTIEGGYILAIDSMIPNCTNQSIRVLKMDNLGNIQWLKRYEYIINNYGGGVLGTIKQVSDGNYIITANTTKHPNHILLIKIDTDGNILWHKVYMISPDENIHTGGYMYFEPFRSGVSAVEMDDHGFLLTANSYNINDNTCSFRVIKTNYYGEVIWAKEFFNLTSISGNQLELIGNGLSQGFILCSKVSDTTNISVYSILLSHIDYNGNIVWSKVYYGDSVFNQGATSIKKTLDNGYIVTGSSTFSQGYRRNIMTMKIDSLGNIAWSWVYILPSSYSSVGISIKLTSDGGYIIGSNIYGYPGEQHNSYAALIKIDSNGNNQWNKAYYGEDNYSYLVDIEHTPDNGYTICGCTFDSIPNIQPSSIYFLKADSVGNTNCFESSFSITQSALTFQTYSVYGSQFVPEIDSIYNCYAIDENIEKINICSNIYINEINLNENTISIYPNPNPGSFFLSYNHKYSLVNFQIKDLSGKSIFKRNISNNIGKEFLDVSSLSNGIYIWEVISETETLAKGKIVIIK